MTEWEKLQLAIAEVTDFHDDWDLLNQAITEYVQWVIGEAEITNGAFADINEESTIRNALMEGQRTRLIEGREAK